MDDHEGPRFSPILPAHRFGCVLVVALLNFAWPVAAHAEELLHGSLSSRPSTPDDTVESIKRDALELNRDLGILEEQRLFPAAVQMAVFVFLDAATTLRVESVQLKLDGKAVARHRYDEREAQALARGGAHRLYTGNLANGRHELVAVFDGKDASGHDYRRGATFRFIKTAGPKYVELHIRTDAATRLPILVMKDR